MRNQRKRSGALMPPDDLNRQTNRLRSMRGAAALAGVPCSISKPYLSSGTFQRGARGNHVQSLQADLKAWGYYDDSLDFIDDDSLDGVFGANTEAAVEYYQHWRGIYVDGIVGSDTQTDLCTFLEINGDPNPEPGDDPGDDDDDPGNDDPGNQNPDGNAGGTNWPLYAAAGALGVGTIIMFARKRNE